MVTEAPKGERRSFIFYLLIGMLTIQKVTNTDLSLWNWHCKGWVLFQISAIEPSLISIRGLFYFFNLGAIVEKK